MQEITNDQHNVEIHLNKTSWEQKPLLRKIYFTFYERIKAQIDFSIPGHIVELGSGLGNIKQIIPEVITTDIFQNPWIDQVESAYNLSFEDNSVSHLILFDVFHHLEYPLAALKEFERVTKKGGKIIVFDPDMSLFGLLVYGVLHHEPVGILRKINKNIPSEKIIEELGYYAAQGNANRFLRKKNEQFLAPWKLIHKSRYSDISYVLSGGYSKKAMYAEKHLDFLKRIEKILNYIPRLFSTRLMVVLQKG